MNPYESFGGEHFFTELVHHFYEGVKTDDVLKPMYPYDEFEAAERRLRLFLMQYWGGPTTYSDERGHPRLRMRHNPFPIDDDARVRWLHHMNHALDLTEKSFPLEDALKKELIGYFHSAALAMVNTWPEHRELPTI